MHSYFKREDPGQSHNQIKAIPKSNSVNLSVLILGLVIFWAPEGLGGSSAALPSTAHAACLVGSGQIHSTFATVLGYHLMLLASPKCWDFCCNRAAPSSIASLGSLQGLCAISCQVSTSLHETFSSKLLLQLRLHLQLAFPSLS